MKKHYIRLTVIICFLVLIVFVTAGGFYTYLTATDVMNDTMDQIENMENYGTAYYSGLPGNALSDVYSEFRRRSAFCIPEGVGFFSRTEIPDTGVIRTSPFILIEKQGNSDSGEADNIRFIPLSEEIGPADLELMDFTVEGLCDDVFIFDGSFSFYDSSTQERKTVEIGNNDLAESDNAVSYEEWAGEEQIHAVYYSMARDDHHLALNSEAEEFLDTFLATDSYKETRHKDIRTSYYISYCHSWWSETPGEVSEDIPDDALFECSVYLFHPLEMTFATHRSSYIIGVAALIFIQALIIFIMNRLYRNRVNYDLRRKELTRGIAHDLKTPLAVTKAYAENWDYLDEKDKAEYADKLKQEVAYMNVMVNDLLDMAKLDSGNIKIKPEDVDLHSLTKAVCEQMKPLISERGINLDIATDGKDNGAYTVRADSEMMRIAIGNFISNAVKYAESKIRIELLGSSGKVTFMITNDGTPIDKKEQKKVWDAFYKADKSRTDRLDSSGMGLAINKSILDLHKAKYDCSSDRSGTTFRFEIKRG